MSAGSARRSWEDEEKICISCRLRLPIAEFYVCSSGRGRQSRCRSCWPRRAKRVETASCGHEAIATSGEIGCAHGVRGETVVAWARRGLIPSVQSGKQLRFCAPCVDAELLAATRAPGPTIKACSACGIEQHLERFRWVSKIQKGKRYRYLSPHCNGCCADQKMVQRLVKLTGLPAHEIPPALIEAKRVQLMINRLAASKEARP